MSDAEAGDSEFPENPEPEDDADLSNHASSNTECEPARSELAGSELSETVDQLASEAHLPEEEQHGTGGLCQLDNGGENPIAGSEIQEKSAASAADVKADTLPSSSSADLEWPPESEREGAGDSSSSAQPELTEEHGFVDASAVISGSESQDSSQIAEVQPEAEIQKKGVENGAERSDHASRNSIESSDPEESPPEDDLFREGAAPVLTDLADTSNPAPESETVGAAENDSQPSGSHNAETAVAVEQDSDDIPATTGTNGSEARDGTASNVADAAHSPSQSFQTQPDSTSESSVIAKEEDKEDDQVPECDREQTVSSDGPQGSYPAPSQGESVDVREGAGNELSSLGGCPVNDSATAVSATSTFLPEESMDAVASAGSGSPVHESVSDRGRACNPQSVSAQSCVSPSPMENLNSKKKQTGSECRVSPGIPSSACSRQLQKSTFLDMDSDDEDLLTELDAELHLPSSPRQQQQQQQRSPAASSQVLVNGLKQMDGSNSELCKQFEEQLLQLQEQVLQKDREIHRLQDEKTRQRQVSQDVMAERDKLRAELVALKDKNPDDLYLPQIKELEYTISQQQMEIRQLKEKLTQHDGAARRAIATLQSEMKARIDQITKLYEESAREKDSMVIRFAEAETKNIEAKRAVEKMEAKMRDVLKEKEFLNNKMRAAVADRQKAVADLEARNGEMGTLQKEMEKLKEDLSSADYRIKWFQNKLKAELEAHKETKQSLEKTASKLREAKEETEVIRRDCQAIIKTYQESEEVRSNSLDKELKMKETELLIQRKEKSDTEEVHLQTKRELDSLKVKHKDAIEELKTLRDKVQCLEEERMQSEQVQNKYQSIIQSQKGDNANLQKQLTDFHTLKEDFDRAQDMIKTLDREISDLKITNRDLTKDIEGCQARESKMLALQSELSRTNALLRSENTNFNNQVVTLSGEVQKMTMDLQDLETRCRNVTEQLEEEQKKRKEETTSLSTQLTAKTKQCDEYKQKWEDEIDANKTLKRKHAHNVKDLTRQLQHAKKRLESYETGSGDRDATSMGSRTNSNGSLNSMDASSQHNANQHNAGQHNHQPSAAQPRRQSQEPEFPVITEQVEVDKQVLIERIVRLQRSLARKNEKLEFLEEHIQQLVAEIKKKNKIIQGYIMREEAGTLVSDDMDANKALLARKGGIMASVYSMHQQDGAMTLDLSLEINRKLQAVLEDTLLKNMTLKENLDTLGAEIARLSQENRRLQLHLQQLQPH